MRQVFIVAARRTPIAPKNGSLGEIPFFDLAACAIRAVLQDLSARGDSPEISAVFAGNALGAGGNPARLMALASGLPQGTSALTIDTQCCSGLDAIGLALERLRGKQTHELMLAGGAESASLAPIRLDRRTRQTYEQAPFTPWPDRDPDMISAAIGLGQERGFTEPDLLHWVERSFSASAERALIVECSGATLDRAPRLVTPELYERCARFQPYNPLLMAPMADGAAFVAVTNQPHSPSLGQAVLEVLDYCQVGADPECPGLSCGALAPWLADCEARFSFDREQIRVSLMESFVPQVLANIQDLGLSPANVNPWGGLLSRGHPIGASGAVLVCDLFEQFDPGEIGLAVIPAAGGLASGLLVRRLS